MQMSAESFKLCLSDLGLHSSHFFAQADFWKFQNHSYCQFLLPPLYDPVHSVSFVQITLACCKSLQRSQLSQENYHFFGFYCFHFLCLQVNLLLPVCASRSQNENDLWFVLSTIINFLFESYPPPTSKNTTPYGKSYSICLCCRIKSISNVTFLLRSTEYMKQRAVPWPPKNNDIINTVGLRFHTRCISIFIIVLYDGELSSCKLSMLNLDGETHILTPNFVDKQKSGFGWI